MTETDLVKSILFEFGSRPGLRIWRHNVGAAKDKRGALIRFGMAGQPDIMGIIAPSGRFLAVEAKTATGRQTEDQRKWQKMAESLGALYVLARSTEDVRLALATAAASPATTATMFPS